MNEIPVLRTGRTLLREIYNLPKPVEVSSFFKHERVREIVDQTAEIIEGELLETYGVIFNDNLPKDIAFTLIFTAILYWTECPEEGYESLLPDQNLEQWTHLFWDDPSLWHTLLILHLEYEQYGHIRKRSLE